MIIRPSMCIFCSNKKLKIKGKRQRLKGLMITYACCSCAKCATYNMQGELQIKTKEDKNRKICRVCNELMYRKGTKQFQSTIYQQYRCKNCNINHNLSLKRNLWCNI